MMVLLTHMAGYEILAGYDGLLAHMADYERLLVMMVCWLTWLVVKD